MVTNSGKSLLTEPVENSSLKSVISKELFVLIPILYYWPILFTLIGPSVLEHVVLHTLNDTTGQFGSVEVTVLASC